ncbi:MAG TPA: sulfotransferase, partial [Pseudomonadales bacterium]|nr:sulfotransferase [Pseudomonadales bacterium]
AFDVQTLLAEASAATGLSNFGAEDFKGGLQKLIETYTSNGFDERGIKRNRKRLLKLLQVRLKIEAAWQQHPEIRDVKIKAPMFLTGLPRTGTSALLNLLSQDVAARPLKLWEGMSPDPLPSNPPEAEDPRYVQLKAFYEEAHQKNPNFDKIHFTNADTPEECIHLLNHTFQDVQFGVETMMEPYGAWFQQQDHLPSYRYYADILRMLQWQRPGERWLLKTPAHLWALDCLVQLFPDCSIVITHRNPLECVTSYASMMESMLIGREFDRKQFGAVVMEYLARKVEASLRQREQIDPARILDLQFNDFIADGVGTVRRIYQHFHLPMSAEVEQRFQRYADAHPMGKHGKHDYRLEEYGLTEQQIRERFAFYIERFQVPMA